MLKWFQTKVDCSVLAKYDCDLSADIVLCTFLTFFEVSGVCLSVKLMV